jgi:hypothetical protein
MASTRFSATDLLQLERQLHSWRRGRRGRRRLPEEVWEAAVALARTQGLSRVARGLRLDYYKLQRLICDTARAAAPKSTSVCPPGFVEMACPSPVGGPTACRVELRNRRGATMTLHLPNDTAAVVTLAEAFWRRS